MQRQMVVESLPELYLKRLEPKWPHRQFTACNCNQKAADMHRQFTASDCNQKAADARAVHYEQLQSKTGASLRLSPC